ncbi:MAG: hypothetical protein ACLP5H_21690 [Desulfomonilaceae bacterium]
MSTSELIKHVAAQFGRIYLGGIPLLLNDDGAFLSFICILTATEALGGFLNPNDKNGPRFKKFVRRYFPNPYPAQADALWKLRNAAVHGFSPHPYKLTHHNSHVHLNTDGGLTMLNAEDFYAVLVGAAKNYFDELQADTELQEAFLRRANDPDTGILVVAAAVGSP